MSQQHKVLESPRKYLAQSILKGVRRDPVFVHGTTMGTLILMDSGFGSVKIFKTDGDTTEEVFDGNDPNAVGFLAPLLNFAPGA